MQAVPRSKVPPHTVSLALIAHYLSTRSIRERRRSVSTWEFTAIPRVSCGFAFHPRDCKRCAFRTKITVIDVDAYQVVGRPRESRPYVNTVKLVINCGENEHD